MSSPELSPRRDRDRSRSRSIPVEEDVNGRSRSPADLSPRRSPVPDDLSPAPARDDSRSPVRDVRDEPSPVRRSPSLERGRDLSQSPVRRTRSRSRPVRERSLVRGDSRDDLPRRRSVSREPRRRSFSRDRDTRRRSPSRDRDAYRRRSPSPYARRARSPYGSRDYRRSPPRRAYSPYGGRRRSPMGRRFSPPRGFRGGMGRRATPPSRGLHMFVAGLNFITNERELDERFSRYGRVKEARIVRNPRTGESRGFGFVMMEVEEDVDQAIRHLDGRDWNGRRLLVERARNVK